MPWGREVRGAEFASALRRCPSGEGSALWLSRSARFTGSLRVFLAVEPADMRKGMAGLHALVGERLSEDVQHPGRGQSPEGLRNRARFHDDGAAHG